MSDVELEPRPKRQKIDKQGKFAAFARLKDLKGSKNKYELSEDIDNVYDTVDEKEYAKLVLNRACDDWIDDDGTGYVEDGREIFDDEICAEEQQENKKQSKKRESNKRSREEKKPVQGKGSIGHLFSNAIPKKKTNVNIAEDQVLADILGEMNNATKPSMSRSSVDHPVPSSSRLSKANNDNKNEATLVNEYMASFSKNIKKKVEKKDGNSSDDEMLDRILLPQKRVITKEVEVIDQNTDYLEIKDEVNEIMEKTEAKILKTEEPMVTRSTLIEPKIKSFEECEEDFKDMDYSILDDLENQISDNKLKVEIKNPTEEFLLTGWNNITSIKNEDETVAESINVEVNPENENEMKIWYWDIWEEPLKRPGQVYIFGRVSKPDKPNEFQSVCVHIENVERCIYLLPREFAYSFENKMMTKEPVTLIDVYKEFDEKIASVLKLSTYRTRKVIKNFSFKVDDIDVPESCEYLEVRYEGKKMPPNILKKYRTIAHIFGANTNALETFLLECKLKGPCWLNIKNFKIAQPPLSFCAIELRCSSVDSISLVDKKNQSPPPLVTMAINVRTVLNLTTYKNEIVSIACLVNNKFALDKPNPNLFTRHFCAFTRTYAQIWPTDIKQKLDLYHGTTTHKMESEKNLLNWFLSTYQHIDPDLIVTHDGNDCQLDVICERLQTLKIQFWSRIGRVRMSNIISKKWKDFFIGRMVCDIKSSAEELIKSRSYDLDTLCKTVLKIKDGERIDVSNEVLISMYETSDGILKLISLSMQDCSYIARLMSELNVLPLALQITTICGNIMGRTLQGGRSERNEFLLLHAFHEKNYIVPDKKESNWSKDKTAPKKKAAYSGGLVLEPITGYYDTYILLMDFNSLYPSIIQEYNICFTTIIETDDKTTPVLPEPSVEQGVLPRQIRRLVESRKEVKKLMANSDLEADLRAQYNIRQLALKLTANSMYGCLGFGQSRFYAQHLAALVTLKGREILMNTKSLVEKLNYTVVYGDTDSIMINTNVLDYDQVYKIGNNIKQAVNKIYRQVELDIDGVFRYLLLLKKKKYAAVTVTRTKKGEMLYNQELKGLDIVRRDWSQIAVMAGKIIVNEILSDNSMMVRIENILTHLEKFGKNITENSVPLPLLIITKQLMRNPKDYLVINSLPHVQVALRMNSTRNKRYKKGDVISYIICDDGTDNPAMQRAYHLDEIKSSNKLKVDSNYYLAQQIHPVVSRLCDPIDEIDSGQIAVSLGLNDIKYKVNKHVSYDIQSDIVGESILPTYNLCNSFKFNCISCKTENEIITAFRNEEKIIVPVLLQCQNKECTVPPYKYVCGIQNKLVLTIRSYYKKFLANWLLCDDPTCNNRTRMYTHVTVNMQPVCMNCKQGFLTREYSATDLYLQLCYFESMFNLQNNPLKSVKIASEVEAAYESCKRTVDTYLSNSKFAVIDLNNIFKRTKIGK